jgi:transcriptional regulator with XRE-family HTH domain
VDAYERRAFPLEPLSPIEAIKARCEQLGWSRKDLEPLIGSRARVSEVLTGKRALTLPMIRGIHRAMGIPADILISEAQLEKPIRTRRGSGPSVARATSQRATSKDGVRKRRRSSAHSYGP